MQFQGRRPGTLAAVSEGPIAHTIALTRPLPAMKPANHHVITGIDETACADVGQLGIGAFTIIARVRLSDQTREVA
jgi:hypothetical protein